MSKNRLDWAMWSQMSPWTRWLWRRWQHEDTGRQTLLPIWRRAGRRWRVVPW